MLFACRVQVASRKDRGAAWLLATLLMLAGAARAGALGQTEYVQSNDCQGCFILAHKKATAALRLDPGDYPGVIRAARDLQADIARVTGRTPDLTLTAEGQSPDAVIIGTIGKSAVIDRLVSEGKLDTGSVAGKWESFVVETVANPSPGIERGLVIAGSDKRGTIFGVYDLCEQIGVSPWHYWADVPVRHRDSLFVRPGRSMQGEPAVRYRGIFLNDEAPALTGWVKEKFGGYNHEFYVKVFELLLRLKGNYLWPAMWAAAFNEDDPLNPKLADEYGIVMGTSHHEPMLRAQQEWKRHGQGPWDYTANGELLRAFWSEGLRRNRGYESIITLAMRGDGDMPMSSAANVELLERIVADQRQIIAREVNPDLGAVPQLWALYKEVQEYYEKGMRVPDDVTLLWCDDNWGNIRRLPTAEERKRKGGAGIYYHFDYVGGPRSYKWLNTVPITKIWEQMMLARDYGADRIWIVNVGDLKPMEFPIEFFLSLAWDPERWPKEALVEYGRLWAEREFGPRHSSEIADIVARYTKYNARRKPELLEPTTYSLVNYAEAERVLADWHTIVSRAERIYNALDPSARDAFYQLVLFPAKASSVVTQLYVAAGKNQLYASQGRANTNDLAVQTRALFETDARLADEFNHKLAGGKWNHMMDQTHIGYTYWNQPPANSLPKLSEIELPAAAALGVAIEGSTTAWPGASGEAALPPLDAFNRKPRYIDVFNRGREPFSFTATTSADWIKLSTTRASVEKERRLWVDVDWGKVPGGSVSGAVSISGPKAPEGVTVNVTAFSPEPRRRGLPEGFVEADGHVSIEAAHFTRKTDGETARWEPIFDFGRTLSGMAVFPVTAPSANPPQGSACLEYQMQLFAPGEVEVEAILAPTLGFVPGRGLRYAISFDREPPQVIDALAQNSLKDWEATVKDSVRKVRTTHNLATSGMHVLKFWMVDPGVVLEKLVVDMGGVRPSYLGPPESSRR